MNIVMYVMSAVTAGVIAGGGALLTAMANGGDLIPEVYIAAGVTTLIAAAKDFRTYMAKPPELTK